MAKFFKIYQAVEYFYLGLFIIKGGGMSSSNLGFNIIMYLIHVIEI